MALGGLVLRTVQPANRNARRSGFLSPESGAGVKGRENLHISRYLVCDYLVLRVDSSFQVSYLFFGHSRSSLCSSPLGACPHFSSVPSFQEPSFSRLLTQNPIGPQGAAFPGDSCPPLCVGPIQAHASGPALRARSAGLWWLSSRPAQSRWAQHLTGGCVISITCSRNVFGYRGSSMTVDGSPRLR